MVDSPLDRLLRWQEKVSVYSIHANPGFKLPGLQHLRLHAYAAVPAQEDPKDQWQGDATADAYLDDGRVQTLAVELPARLARPTNGDTVAATPAKPLDRGLFTQWLASGGAVDVNIVQEKYAPPAQQAYDYFDFMCSRPAHDRLFGNAKKPTLYGSAGASGIEQFRTNDWCTPVKMMGWPIVWLSGLILLLPRRASLREVAT
jgi:hypothetical protein